MKVLLSVIVPVYNVCDVLTRCVQSIICQCGEQSQVLLIDDGSTDASGSVADLLAAQDERISVFHKENGGLSDARNYGLERAEGMYVTFVDSDDELAPSTLPSLLNLLAVHPQVDMLEYSARIRVGRPDSYSLTLPDRLWHSTYRYWTQTEGWEHTYAWNKVFRRSLLASCRFPVGRVFEDMWFMPSVLAQNPCILTTACGHYIYHWNESGITATADGNDLAQLLEAQMYATRQMRVGLFSCNGWKMYRSMLCRQLDVYRLTGRILLPWWGIKWVCKLHSLCRC